MIDVNLLAVLLCGISSMILGGIWYSPLLFGKAWQRETGLSDERIAGGNMAMIYGLAFLLSLGAAYVFAALMNHFTSGGLGAALHAGAAAGIAWVAASFGISYLFERRSLALWLINGGYHAVQFILFGLILGLMG